MFGKVKENLLNLGYTVNVFETASQAADYLDSVIDNKSVGFGGSVTVTEMDLYSRLGKHNKVTSHAHIPEGKTDSDMRMASRGAEIYISSVNGLSEDGEIINIDATGNRVASIFYGHEKVYLIIGKNKLSPNYESALWRARNIASPKNAKRLGVKTPCAEKADKCYNCKSSQRICRGLTVLWQKPMKSDIEILLVEENLGY